MFIYEGQIPREEHGGGGTRTYISSRFREFQETQRDRMGEERGVISLREENLTLLRFEKFANRGLRDRESKETMEERRQQLKFLGFLDSRNPQARSKVIAMLRFEKCVKSRIRETLAACWYEERENV